MGAGAAAWGAVLAGLVGAVAGGAGDMVLIPALETVNLIGARQGNSTENTSTANSTANATANNTTPNAAANTTSTPEEVVDGVVAQRVLVDVNLCPDQCYGHGVCKQLFPDEPECDCDDGFHGEMCSRSVRPVTLPTARCPGHCSGKGKCILETHECECLAGFVGPACAQVGAEASCAELNRCSGQGQCQLDTATSTYTCACNDGFTGDDCSTVVDVCNCRHGTCVTDADGAPACECGSGFLGDQCDEYDKDVDACGPSLSFCSGQGVCSSIDGIPVCHCGAHYGGGSCDQVAGSCGRGCGGRGRCDPMRGKCACTEGWSGADCEVDRCAPPTAAAANASVVAGPPCTGRGTCERAVQRPAAGADRKVDQGVTMGMDVFEGAGGAGGVVLRVVGWSGCEGAASAVREARRLQAVPYRAVVEVQMEASSGEFERWLNGSLVGLQGMNNGMAVGVVAARVCPLMVTIGTSLFLGGATELEALVRALVAEAFVCRCDVGWTGEQCTQKDMAVWTLCDRMCSGHGVCRLATSGSTPRGVCVCDHGYWGAGCDRTERPAGCCRGGASGDVGVEEDCAGNGRCVEDRAAGECTCECFGGYAGSACQHEAEGSEEPVNATAANATDTAD